MSLSVFEVKVWSYIHAFVLRKDLVEITKEFQPLLCTLRVHRMSMTALQKRSFSETILRLLACCNVCTKSFELVYEKPVPAG